MGSDTRLDAMLRSEWLETNGLGSYASGTSAGAATRRYHGLLVAALDPPVRRHVLLSNLDETLIVDGTRVPLATHVYRGAVHPEGYRHLTTFEARPVATWTYAVPGAELERRVWLPHGRQAACVTYRCRPARPDAVVTLEVRPFVAFRDFHSLLSANDAIDESVESTAGRLVVRPYDGMPVLTLHHDARSFAHEPVWYRQFEYRVELERGYPGHEDLFCYGTLVFDLSGADESFGFIYAAAADGEPVTAGDARSLERAELARRSDWASRAARARASARPAGDPGVHAATSPALDRWGETFATRLAEAAEQFLARRADGRRTVIAGYHWFADWGRDTFVSLPGLALATGRWPLAYELLRTFAAHVDLGMIPNHFPEEGSEPEYNSVDAALWFVESGRRYVRDSGDLDFARRELFPRIEEIIDWYTRGTRYGIHVDPSDGLLAAGADGVALTWMDAVVDGAPVTPRRGKPVEINALWYNALLSGADIAQSLGRRSAAEGWRAAAMRMRESFNSRFWNGDAGCCYDVVDGPDGDDASLRPNQLLAISLFHDVLEPERRISVVEAVEARLLTPVGVRTLDPEHPGYVGRYEGSPEARDAAYHNGTVWPWLLGPFAGAYLKAHGRTSAARERVRDLVAPLARHLGTEGCLGQLSEIMDADPPYSPRGCVAQAWSVAEVARVLLEELRQ
jgi:glycogen debranching enzyme